MSEKPGLIIKEKLVTTVKMGYNTQPHMVGLNRLDHAYFVQTVNVTIGTERPCILHSRFVSNACSTAPRY